MADAPVSVFISYSRKDSGFVDRLEADLRAYGFTTWVDRQHLEGGDDWASKIEQQILAHEAFVVTLSPDAITSDWVRREITFALNCGRHIIPIIARPVTSAPISIIEKQRIDLSSNYNDGVQELRVILLKLRALPAPPTTPRTPQPLLAPDITDPLKGLVEIPPAPPAPNTDLNAIFMQAQAALARGSLDLAEALLRQVVEKDPAFGNGVAGEDLEQVRKKLAPVQVERLQRMANESHARGAWGEEIGALRALADRLPNDGTIADRLEIAEECQKWGWLYDNARSFAEAQDVVSTTAALMRLWEKAPNYGDPARIAPPGLSLPSSGTSIAARRYASLPQGHTILDFSEVRGRANVLRWSPDGSRLACGWQKRSSSDLRNALHIKDVRDGASIVSYPGQNQIADIAWMSDGHAIVATDGGDVRFLQTSRESVVFTLHKGVQAVTTKASLFLGSAMPYDGSSLDVFIWDSNTGAQINVVHRDDPFGIQGQYHASSINPMHCWSPNGALIAAWYERVITIIASDSLQAIGRFDFDLLPSSLSGEFANVSGSWGDSQYFIRSVAWSPESTYVLLGCEDCSIHMIRMTTSPRTPTQQPAGRTTENRSAGSATPQPVAGVSMSMVLTCGGHVGGVTAVAWSPDGKRLASGSSDGVRLWDSSDGRLLYIYTEHTDEITALAFSPDSSRIASGDSRGQVRIWKV